MEKKKIMAVASIGGHWVQLLRLAKPLEEQYEVVYVCTHPKCQTMVEDREFYLMKNFSRWDAWKCVPAFFHMLGIILKVRPKAIITTGAAPGLVSILVGKMLFIKTIWIDSVANVQHLSFSGRIATMFASKTYTQWNDLATEKVAYAGNIIG